MRGALVRKVILFGILGVVVLLVIFDRAPGKAMRAAEGRALAQQSQQQQHSAAGNDPALEKLGLPNRAALGKARGKLFGSPPPPPPPVRVAAHAPPPEAPPLPYRFAGVALVGGERQVYLSKGNAIFDVKSGAILDGSYHVDAIDQGHVRLTYLPLQKQETIPITSAFAVSPPSAPTLAAVAAPTQVAAPSPSTADSAGAAHIAWDGPARVRVGTPFKVALRVNSSQAVHAMPMRLRFNPTLLEAIAVAPGNFFLRSNKRFVTRVDPSGSIFVGATKESAAPAADAELIVVTMRPVKSSPAAELKISALNLEGASGNSIALASLPPYRTEITP